VATRGLGFTLQRVWQTYVFGTQRFAIFRNALAGPPPPPDEDGLVVRPFGPEDVDLLGAFEPHRRARELQAHLEDGCWLDFALDGPRPIAYRVVSLAGPRHLPLALVVTLEPGQVWVVDLFCRPDYRGRGIGTRLSVAMDRRLAALGYREVLLANRLDNPATIRLSARKGNQPLFWCSYRRVLCFSRCTISTDLTKIADAASRGERVAPAMRSVFGGVRGQRSGAIGPM
jgi:GNAT superfamily N-acetyltransferase